MVARASAWVHEGPEPRPSSSEAQAELRDGQEKALPFRPRWLAKRVIKGSEGVGGWQRRTEGVETTPCHMGIEFLDEEGRSPFTTYPSFLGQGSWHPGE
jgi:hypothetical protein